jgi:hypothetical protein
MREFIVFLVGIVVYVVIYYYLVHGRLKCEYMGVEVGESPCKIVRKSIFDRNAIFNPSMVTRGGRLVTIHRHTPGHQLGAAISYISPEENGFEVNGIKYRERAVIGWGFNPSESVYVPVNIFPWQWENGIWKQGEDIRLISPTECTAVFPYIFEGKLMSRLVRCRIIRDTTTKKLILEPIKLLSPYGESHKNWVCLRPQIYLTSAFPRWEVREESGEEILKLDMRKILGKLNIKMSHAIHLGGCSCMWNEDRMIVVMHTVRPYRNILCEICSRTYKPLRFSHTLQLSESRGTFIENVTGVCNHKSKLYLSWGYEDQESRFTILTKDGVEKLLCIDVSDIF